MMSPGCARFWPARMDPPLLPGTPMAARSSPRSAPTRPTSLVWSTSPRSGWMRVNRSAPSWSRHLQVPPWRISTLTNTASPGSPRTTSSTTSRPTSTRSGVDQPGFPWIPEDAFVNHFAADVDPVTAKVMFAVQQPLHWSALGEVMGVPAWKSLPSWFLIADGDQAIPPDAQRQVAPRMGATTGEVSTNHVAMVSHPDEVLQLIKTAAEAVASST